MFSTGAFAAPVLQLTIDDTSVYVRGATAHGALLVVGYQRSVRGFEPVFRRIERLVDADADGRAELTLPSAKSHDSFWVAIDLTTGAFGSAAPVGKPSRGETLPSAALLRGRSGGVEGIAADCDHVFVVIVRPGSGAWRGTAGDGAPSDMDGRANGRVEVAAKTLARIRGSGEPNIVGSGRGLRPKSNRTGRPGRRTFRHVPNPTQSTYRLGHDVAMVTSNHRAANYENARLRGRSQQ